MLRTSGDTEKTALVCLNLAPLVLALGHVRLVDIGRAVPLRHLVRQFDEAITDHGDQPESVITIGQHALQRIAARFFIELMKNLERFESWGVELA